MSFSGTRIAAAVAIVSAVVGAIRIGSTWKLFTETRDEAFHVACGLQWLSEGRYTYETLHPPLARVVLAMGPYAAGARSPNSGNPAVDGWRLLINAPDYYTMLALARAPNLIFFAIACAAVWLIARPLGPAVAAASVAVFSLIPVVLGHAGVATTDMALTGFLGLAWWSWRQWRQRPHDIGRGVHAGCATASAMLSKFSAAPFLIVALIPVVVLRRREKGTEIRWKSAWRPVAAAAAACILLCWAVYRFDVSPARTPPDRSFLFLDHLLGMTGWAHDTAYRILELPLPMAALFRGVGETFVFGREGHPAYLFGAVSQHGWWYFFPVVLAVKTPLAFAALAVIGAVAAICARVLTVVECLAAAAAILLVSMAAHINIGVRHILPIYLFLAPAAGFAAVHLWQRSRAAAVVLCAWMLAGSVAAHPHYLADFNLLAGREPERIVVDSDLDWGQDLRFATEALRARGAREAWLVVTVTPAQRRQTGVTYRSLPKGMPVRGWVAASVRSIRFENAWARATGQPEPYGWLKGVQPVARAGRSILIYDLSGAGP